MNKITVGIIITFCIILIVVFLVALAIEIRQRTFFECVEKIEEKDWCYDKFLNQ